LGWRAVADLRLDSNLCPLNYMPIGIAKNPQEKARKISEKLRGKCPKNPFKKGHVSWNYRGMKKQCLICKKEFHVKPANFNIAKFCSHKCKGDFFIGKNHTEETKRKMSISQKRIGNRPPSMLSKKMSESQKRNIINGIKNHWDKRGRVTPENKRLRGSNQFRIWREAVFNRDNYTCFICGERGGELHPHHIFQFAYYSELRFNIQNGITLCSFCHKAYTNFGFNKKL
jgi:5-methylcytosine-specific restriction endonuclease McrA